MCYVKSWSTDTLFKNLAVFTWNRLYNNTYQGKNPNPLGSNELYRCIQRYTKTIITLELCEHVDSIDNRPCDVYVVVQPQQKLLMSKNLH